MKKREILFRGWNKKNKKWLYGYYFVNRGEHFISPDEFVNPLASYEDYVVEADTVGEHIRRGPHHNSMWLYLRSCFWAGRGGMHPHGMQ